MLRKIVSITAVILLVSLALLTALPASRSQVELNFLSQQGDWIGQGVQHIYENEGAIAAGPEKVTGVLQFGFSGNDGSRWQMSFAAPSGAALEAGKPHEGAERYVTGKTTSPKPAMLVSGMGRTCQSVSGSFQLQELEMAESGAVERVELTFSQFCNGGTNELAGYLRFVK